MCLHRHANCAGRWERQTKFFSPVWQCDSCGASYAITDANTEAAANENRFGVLIRGLADEWTSSSRPVNRLAGRGVL